MNCSPHISVNFINQSFVRVTASDRATYYELSDYFKFQPSGYQFTPAFKERRWDGYIKLFNTSNHCVYRGLMPQLEEFARARSYEIRLPDAEGSDFGYRVPGPGQIDQFISDIKLSINGSPITPFDYQLNSVKTAIANKKQIILSPTSSGKTLILYMILRIIDQIILAAGQHHKILIVVPNISLLHQTFADFCDYSSMDDQWDPIQLIHRIAAGAAKDCDKNIYFTTWQSVFKRDHDYFRQFGCVIIDECHLGTANSLKGIMEKSSEAVFRIGLTGTIDDSKTEAIVLSGLFGPINDVISTKKLMDQGTVADLTIKNLNLIYPADQCKAIRRSTYQQEIEFVEQHPKRLQFISNLASKTPNNTLILTTKIEYGKALCKSIRKIVGNTRKVVFVSGSMKGEDREKVRQLAEVRSDIIVVATYATFSTGISIKNLHYVIFATPTKSKVRTLQSIGRGLRVSDEKTGVKLFDIIDNLQWKSWKGFSIKHSEVREQHYRDQQFNFTTSHIKL